MCTEPPSPFLCCAYGEISPHGLTRKRTPWKSYAVHSAEVPKILVDTALDALRTTPVQAVADDKEQMKRREEWWFLCLELVGDDLNVTLNFCVDTYVVKTDELSFVKYVMKSITWVVGSFVQQLYNKNEKQILVYIESPQSRYWSSLEDSYLHYMFAALLSFT